MLSHLLVGRTKKPVASCEGRTLLVCPSVALGLVNAHNIMGTSGVSDLIILHKLHTALFHRTAPQKFFPWICEGDVYNASIHMANSDRRSKTS